MNLALMENLQVAWSGIVINKVRSVLTMLGVVIGVATVIALLSIGQGANQAVTSRITSTGTDLLFVRPGASTGPGGVQGASGSASTLILADAAAIADPISAPDVRLVAPEFDQRAQLVVGANNVNAQVRGVSETYAQVMNLQLEAGRFIEPKDVAGQASVAVLGNTTALNLFGDSDPLGQLVRVTLPGDGGLIPLRVVGVLASQGNSAVFGNTDTAVLSPISTVQNKIGSGRNGHGQPVVSTINIVAAPGRSAAAAEQINALLTLRHKLSADDEADFSVVSQEDLLDVANSVTGTLTIFLGIIAVISLVVGGIGIMNIMLVSVTERTREIGIRKAVGARRSDILLQFLLEAVVLSILGGLTGILLGIGVAWLVSKSGLMTTSVSPGAVLLAFGFALLVGLASGVYPASRAAGLRPIEALRYE